MNRYSEPDKNRILAAFKREKPDRTPNCEVLVEEFLERLAVYHVEQVERLRLYGLTFLYIGDDIAYKSTTIISPDLMRSLWLPRMRRIMAPAVREVGAALSVGTPADVRRDAEELIDSVGRDGGLVLASSHSITPNVKPENFLAMIDTAQTYGVLRDHG